MQLENFFEYIASRQQQEAPVAVEQKVEEAPLSSELSSFLEAFLAKHLEESQPSEVVVAEKAPAPKQEKAAKPVAPGKNGQTPIFRLQGEDFEWKYSTEKDWKVLFSLQDIADRVPIPTAPDRDDSFYGGGGGGKDFTPEFRMYNGTFQWKLEASDDDAWQSVFDMPVVGEEMVLAKNLDMDGDFIYKGEAAPGSATNSPAWRINRTYINPVDDDVSVVWAEGNADFAYAWDDHKLLSYS